jgi:acyl phosphate:glycerol-3-phosphate acyltransferase
LSGILVTVMGAAYLVGAIPFSFLIAKMRGVDIRTVGSGNIGATNLARAFGAVPGTVGLLLDATKGSGAVLLARWVLGDAAGPAVEAAAGVLAVLGHSFTPFLRFRGGKGVATGAGVFLVLIPRALLVALALFLAVVLVSRMVSLGSVAASVALPLLAYVQDAERAFVLAAVVVGGLVVVRHRENLRRIVRGAEPRLGKGGSG